MSKIRKKSIKKEFKTTFIIILVFFCLAIISFQLFMSYHNEENGYASLFQILSFISIGLIIVYSFYFLVRVYLLVIKPIINGQIVVTKISNGERDLRLDYQYDNEVADLVNSFNRFIDLSQKSISIIEEQYSRLKLYSDIGEINYVECNYDEDFIKIFYSKKFIKKYQLETPIITYSVADYVSLIHPDDQNAFYDQIQAILKMEGLEYKLDYRVKYPHASNYCYVSTRGQIQKDKVLTFMGVQVDITYLKAIQERLQKQEEQYRLIVENSTDLITKMSPDGKMLFTSKAFKDLFKNENSYVNDYDKMLKVTNEKWLENVLKPPYSTQEVILIETPLGGKWISWNNDAILDNNNEVQYIVSVGHDITELKRINDKLKFDSEHDVLTGLLNRRGIINALAQNEHITTLAAFFIELNNFKNINDLYGHNVGDELIKLFAKDLLSFEAYGCLIGRLSGDEFLVFVPNFESCESLNFLINYLGKYVNKSYRLNHNDIYLSSSIGYAIYPDDTDDFDKLISFADIAMYESKILRSNKCLRFTKEMYDFVNRKVAILNDLKLAIEKQEFDVYFQEIINVKTNEIAFVEALVRWNSNRGIIMPGDFLPIAEESGLIQYIDLIVIEKSFSIFQKIKSETKYLNTKLTVNISPILLLNTNFPERLNVLAADYGLSKADICVEINENTFVNNKEQSRSQIKSLRELGFIVALDDFGREYSSLSILNKVDFDIIKLDRLFIINLDMKLNIEIINMVNKIAQLTNNLVIVEGVETEEQKDILLKLGCFLMQGFLFSKPAKILIAEKVS